MSRWFHARGREKLGPFTLVELQLRAQQGELQPSDMVLQEGTPQWTSANSIAGLFSKVIPDSVAPVPETLATATPADQHSTAHPVPSGPPRDPGLPDIPGYELLGQLGKGGMGVVYKARHIALNRVVALKMILAGAHAGSEDRKRFFAEAESVARLHHPNIVQVYDVGEHGGVPFFSLEFCDEGSLDRKIAGTPQPAREAAELCETLARAMSAAHEAGIIHRDLKPANVLLASRGRESPAGEVAGDSRPRLAKITDFGLAKQLESDAGVTRSGDVMGTPSYMAPEQARGESKSIGPAADIYALGAILYELLTGRVPFKGASAPDTLLLVTTVEPVPPRQLVPGVPRDLETICLKCLQKEPLRRYLSAAALADDLHRFLDGRPIEARPIGSLERLGRWTKRNPALAAVTLLFLLTLTAGVGGIVWKWREAVGNYEEKEKQRQLADQNADNANTQRELAEQRELEAKRFVYASFMNQLPEAWRAGDLAGVQRYLEAFLPKPDDREDVRGFEWHHYWKRSQGSRLTLFGHGGEVTRLAFFPDNATLVSASRDQTIAFWDTTTGTMKKSVFHGLLTDLTVSPDGKLLAYCYSGLANIKNVDRWQTMGTYGKGEPYFAAFSGNGKVLAVAGKILSLVQVIDASTPLAERSATSLEGQTARAMAISPDGKTLVTGDYSGQLILWDLDPTNLAAGPKKRATVKAHSGKVQSVVLTGDSSLLVSAGEDAVIRLYGVDRTAGNLTAISTLRYRKGAINALALTRDDRTLISAGADGIIRLWDIPGKRNRGELRGHSRAVVALAVSPDGKQLASAGVDSCIKLWALTHLPNQTARGTSVNVLAFSPTEPLLASAGDDGLVKLWDTRTREVKATLAGHPGPVKGAAFTPDGKTLITGGGDEWLRLWDVTTGQERDRLKAVDTVTALAVSPDGSLLAAGSARGWFTLHSLQTGKRKIMNHLHDERISSVVFAPDGKSVALTSWDRYVSIYDIFRNQPKRAWFHHEPIRSAFFTEDSKHLIITSYSGNPTIMDVVSTAGGRYLTGDNISFAVTGAIAPGGKTVYWGTRFGTAGTLLISESPADTGTVCKVTRKDFTSAVNTRSLAVSSDGKYVALGSDDGVVTLYETAPFKAVARLPAHAHAITAVSCSPDSKTYAHGKSDFTVHLTDAASRSERRVLRGHTHVVSAVAFAPDGKTIATASHDQTVRLWDPYTGQERAVWRDFKYPVLALAFSPDRQTLAVSTGRIDVGGEFTLREVSTGRVRSILAGHHATVRGMAFAPDGKTLASVSGDGWHLPGEIKIWDADTGKELATRPGHPGPIFSVAYAPDGRTLATAGDDEMVRLWDVSNPARLLAQGPQFPGHKGKVYSLAFSPDGRTLASAGDDGTIRFWQPILGQPLGLLPGKDAVHSLAFEPHASALLAGGENGELAIYPAATAQEVVEARSQQTGTPLPLDLPAETDRILAQARVKYAVDEKDLEGLRVAARLLEDLEKRHPNPRICRRDRAKVLFQLAEEVRFDDRAECGRAVAEVVSLIEPLADQDGDPDDRLLLGRALNMHAGLVNYQRDPNEADTIYRKAGAVIRGLIVEFPDTEEYRAEAVNIGIDRANKLLIYRHNDSAREVLHETLRLLDDQFAEHGSRSPFRELMADVLEKLLKTGGDPLEERAGNARRLTTLRTHLWIDEQNNPLRQEERARAFLIRGRLLLDSDLDLADSCCKLAADQYERVVAAQPKRMQLRSFLAEAIHEQAEVLFRRKKWSEAESTLSRAIPLQKEVLKDPGDSIIAIRPLINHLTLQVRILLAQGRHAEAARVAEERLTLDADLRSTWRAVAELFAECSRVAGLDAGLSAAQRQQKAKEYADRAMQLLEKLVKNGYRNLTDLEQSPGLDSLRMRDDFKALLQKLRER
jgi:WD40 repeat protein